VESMGKIADLSFYNGKRVLITGHTGFKGTWMCKMLTMLGAEVIGYSLHPPTEPNLFDISGVKNGIISVIGDVRDLACLKDVIRQYKPQIVFHMAAQPIVRESYKNPVYTYETNVLGTVNVLEAIRCCLNVRSFINITTNKVYKNNEWEWGYRECDVLGGDDPYSSSKSCSEMVTDSYRRSFFIKSDTAISTCRAGNVIGGGDFAKDRIIPDCVRAMEQRHEIIVRNPNSVRPYQHVLDPIYAYLLVACYQYENKESYEGSYNVGPDECGYVTTGKLVDMFCSLWGDNAEWRYAAEVDPPHEACYLKLDCSRIKHKLFWQPRWEIAEAMEKTVEWRKAYLQKKDTVSLLESQIRTFLNIDQDRDKI